MEKTNYQKLVDRHKPKESKILNSFFAFVTGGAMGMLANLILNLYSYSLHISSKDASGYMLVTFIFVACLLTGFGVFDEIVHKIKMGVIIPITGFAHSISSAMLDYKEEGPIYGFGSNTFKLAGSVILYGVVSAFIFASIRYFLGG